MSDFRLVLLFCSDSTQAFTASRSPFEDAAMRALPGERLADGSVGLGVGVGRPAWERGVKERLTNPKLTIIALLYRVLVSRLNFCKCPPYGFDPMTPNLKQSQSRPRPALSFLDLRYVHNLNPMFVAHPQGTSPYLPTRLSVLLALQLPIGFPAT